VTTSATLVVVALGLMFCLLLCVLGGIIRRSITSGSASDVSNVTFAL
jgi:hypothetical protein